MSGLTKVVTGQNSLKMPINWQKMVTTNVIQMEAIEVHW
jgi:hypothetical protein